MNWTSETIETLKTLWQAGHSASAIAGKLGGLSRNAVIGKAHRLGLAARPSPIKHRPVIRVERLSGRGCVWPLGDPGDADFHYCGAKAEPSRPYCAPHCAIAYRRRDRDAA
ncbi:MAG: global cell cycle regulator GcrA-like protein [Alphaproteobacteria bacterium]|nr:global cell cycle regulator GcrA-like protein [Alphaproteobacteria bacterium]